MEYLEFDEQTGSFSVGDTIIGYESGATCTVDVAVNGTAGAFFTSDRVGDFIDNEIIYKASYEGELVTNGNMELDANWLDNGTPTTNERSDEQANGGTYSRKFVGDSDSDGVYQIVTSEANAYYTFDAYAYISALTASGLSCWILNSGATDTIRFENITTTGEFVNTSGIVQSTDTGLKLVFCQNGAGAITAYIDDVSVKKITNAALVNGTIQTADDGYKIGIAWSDSITVLPTWSYNQNKPKIEQQNRTPAGKLYVAKLGDYSEFKLDIEFVTSADMAAVNSWWESGAELLFFVTSDSVTEINSVVIISNNTPIDQYQPAFYELYRGTINMET